MTRFLRLLWRGCWLTVAFGLIALAVLVTVARLALPFASDYQERIEGVVGDYLGARVEATELDLEWHRFGPRLRLDGVAIAHPGGDVIEFDRAFVDFRPEFSRRALRIHDVTLAGLDLAVRTDADAGILEFWGLRVDLEAWRDNPADALAAVAEAREEEADVEPGAGLLGALLAIEQLQLTDARIRVEQANGDPQHIDLHDLRLVNRVHHHRLGLHVGLPASWGRSLELSVDAHDLLRTDATPRAQVYLEARALAPAQWSGLFPTGEEWMRPVSGSVDFDLWADWSGDSLEGATLRLGASDLGLVRADHPEVRAENLEGLVAWEQRADGWQLRGSDFRVEHAGGGWRAERFAIARDNEMWRGRADRVELAGLADWAHLLPALDEHVARVSGLDARGRLEHPAFALAPGGAFQLTTGLRDVGWQPTLGWPGLAGLDGELRITPRGGELDIASEATTFNHVPFFRTPLYLERIEGPARLTRDGRGGWVIDAPDLVATNADISTHTRMRLELPAEGSPWLDMQVDFADGNVARKAPYLPVGIMFPQLVSWLDDAIVDGDVPRGRMLFNGPTRDFPFKDRPGVFEVDFDIENVQLAYAPDWPALQDLDARVRFHGQALDIEGRRARIHESTITDISARFPDLTTGELEVEATGDPYLRDLVRLVNESPLRQRLGPFFDGAEGDDGRVGMALNLHIPVDRADETRVEGRLDFTGNRLAQPRFWIDLGDIHGEVAFTEDSLHMDDVAADFHGQPVRIGARTHEQRLAFQAQGDIDAGALLPPAADRLAARVQGRAPWDIRVDVAGADEGGLPSETLIRAESSLLGTRIALPEPFTKEPAARRDLRIDLPIRTGEDRHVLHARLGETIALVTEIDTADEVHVPRGTLHFGRDAPALHDAPGWFVSGELDKVDADVWTEFAQSSPNGDPGATASASPAGAAFAGASIEVGRLEWQGYELGDVGLEVGRGSRDWQIRLASNEARGEVTIPFTAGDGRPLRAHFGLLDLDAILARDGAAGGDHPSTTPASVPHPRTFPALDLRADELRVLDYTLRDTVVITAPTADGMNFHRLHSASPNLTLSGQGHWYQRGEREQTALRMRLETDDFGQGLTQLGLPRHDFVGGNGHIATEVDWAGTPWSIDLLSLNGQMDVRLEDGLITTVDPGPARLISLFSLQALPQRLALDFSSLFRRGYEYDRIRGRMRFDEGNMYVNRLEMEGPPGRTRVGGRIGLLARDFDQEIEFRPALTYSLPVLGTIAGGPAGGLTVTLVQQLMRGLGRDIESVAEVRYALTGSWDEPIVERLRTESPTADRDQAPSGAPRR